MKIEIEVLEQWASDNVRLWDGDPELDHDLVRVHDPSDGATSYIKVLPGTGQEFASWLSQKSAEWLLDAVREGATQP